MIVYVMTCLETDHQYLFFCDREDAISEMERVLAQGTHFSKALQSEWSIYGEDGFECGIVERLNSQAEVAEVKEEWQETLSELEVWQTKDGKTGVEL